MRSTRNLILFLILLAAGAAGLLAYKKMRMDADNAPGALASVDAGQAWPTRKPTSSNTHRLAGGSDPVHQMIDSGASIERAVSAVSAEDGALSHAYAASLVRKASFTCTEDWDPQGAITGGKQPDPTRAWAVMRVAELCEGFDPTKFKLASPGPDIPRLMRESGVDMAASESLRAIRGTQDYFQLYTAGQVLLETGKFPMEEVLPRSIPAQGMTELMTAWAHAVTLVTCGEAGGCGPNSIETASFCASVGCAPGSDINRALKERLPASEYETTLAFHDWLRRQRGD